MIKEYLETIYIKTSKVELLTKKMLKHLPLIESDSIAKLFYDSLIEQLDLLTEKELLSMRESSYQSLIMKQIEKLGGQVVNGNYTKAGEADLQCGFPIDGKLRYLAIEVKTETDFNRLMSGIVIEEGLYKVLDKKKLKKHEALQIFKLNKIRKAGGLALIAYNFEQIQEYIDEQI